MGSSLEAVQNGLLQWCNKRFSAPAPLSAETDLLDSGYLDSLVVMDLVLAIEKQFGVALDSSDISPRHFQSVKALAAFVYSRNGNGQGKNRT
jgi:acyl carrier protein